MRIALVILIFIHGLIHFFGFLKAFGISEFEALQLPISKSTGLTWLLTGLLFIVSAVLILIRFESWWVLGFLSMIISQLLIFNYWSDAKFGTIANVIVLLATVLAYSNYSFKNLINKERVALFNNSEAINDEIIHIDNISHVPTVIQNWLTISGVLGKPYISNVHLTQDVQLKLTPDQSDWTIGTAEQYFTIHPPAFNWNIDSELNAFLSITGRDKFVDGKGEMKIKLLSIIPVADAKNETKVDQATLQRYLAEIVWFPSASLSPYIKWENIDNNSAKATMEYNGIKGSGVFYFDEQGLFKKFTAFRYKDIQDTKPTLWTVNAKKIEERNGIFIPTECEVSWELEDGPWTWLKLNIKSIDYNVEKMPITND